VKHGGRTKNGFLRPSQGEERLFPLEGAVRPKELAKLATESGMPAVAVTDSNNLFGVYEIADTWPRTAYNPS